MSELIQTLLKKFEKSVEKPTSRNVRVLSINERKNIFYFFIFILFFDYSSFLSVDCNLKTVSAATAIVTRNYFNDNTLSLPQLQHTRMYNIFNEHTKWSSKVKNNKFLTKKMQLNKPLKSQYETLMLNSTKLSFKKTM